MAQAIEPKEAILSFSYALFELWLAPEQTQLDRIRGSCNGRGFWQILRSWNRQFFHLHIPLQRFTSYPYWNSFHSSRKQSWLRRRSLHFSISPAVRSAQVCSFLKFEIRISSCAYQSPREDRRNATVRAWSCCHETAKLIGFALTLRLYPHKAVSFTKACVSFRRSETIRSDRKLRQRHTMTSIRYHP